MIIGGVGGVNHKVIDYRGDMLDKIARFEWQTNGMYSRFCINYAVFQQ
jgi:hypothetical protein